MSRRWTGIALGAVAAAVLVSGSCALPPSESCRVYVACQAAVDTRVDTTAYDEGGTCWTLPDTARRCEAQCRAALEALADTPDPPPACVVRTDDVTTSG
jgi:hypothetical protein